MEEKEILHRTLKMLEVHLDMAWKNKDYEEYIEIRRKIKQLRERIAKL